MNKQFQVWGWLNGEDYETGKPASIYKQIPAKDSSDAEDKAEEIFKEEIGTCDVIDSAEIDT